MEEKRLDAAESLELISRMIRNTRQRLERHSGRPFLIWGYTTVGISLLNYAFNLTGLIVRSKIYTVAGFAGMGLSTLFAFYDFYLKQLSGTTGIDASYLNFEILIFAAIFLVMMVIPGHIINCRAKQEKEKNHETC